MTWLRNAVAWFQAHLPFGINNWPSWLNEAFGGVLVVTLLHLGRVHAALVVGIMLSYAYEIVLDPHKWNSQDVEQRTRGMLLGEVVWLVVARIVT